MSYHQKVRRTNLLFLETVFLHRSGQVPFYDVLFYISLQLNQRSMFRHVFYR